MLRFLALALLALGLIADAAGAQVSFLGAVLEDSSRTPVKRFPVALVRFLPRGESVVARDQTDHRGLFQLFTNKPGVYQLEFGDTLIGITYGPVDTVTADTVLVRQYAIQLPPDLPTRVLLEFHVDEPVTQISSSIRYPDDLRQRGVCGEVLASFVVDTLGRAEMETFRVIKSTDPLFSDAVRRGVAQSRFKPARLRGRTVRQLVQQPFAFKIAEPIALSSLYPRRDSLPQEPHFSCLTERPAR